MASQRATPFKFHLPRKPSGYTFYPGRKKVYLPNFTVTLLRTPALSPQWAKFIVPLSFNKLDIRDYLKHVYNVSVLSVRSFISSQPLEDRTQDHRRWRSGKRRLIRPLGIKKMTVQLERPFVWPEPPTNFEPWEKKRYDTLQGSELQRSGILRSGKPAVEGYQNEMRSNARKILSGKVKWGADAQVAQAPVSAMAEDLRGSVTASP